MQQVFSQGIERFVDQRRKDAWHPPSVEPPAEKAAVHLEKRDDVIIVHMNATLLVIRADDNLARKILAMILVDSGVMTQKAATEITGTMPLAVSKNYQTFKAEGAVGLVDKREGQKLEVSTGSAGTDGLSFQPGLLGSRTAAGRLRPGTHDSSLERALPAEA